MNLNFLVTRLKTNQVQYDLDREPAKISVLSSKKMNKYEYLTGEDVGYKPEVLEKVKFQYSPLGEILNKILKRDDRVNQFNK